VIEKPWPGMLRGTYGDPENKRVKEVYFSRFPGKYFTGDGARVDADGDYCSWEGLMTSSIFPVTSWYRRGGISPCEP